MKRKRNSSVLLILLILLTGSSCKSQNSGKLLLRSNLSYKSLSLFLYGNFDIANKKIKWASNDSIFLNAYSINTLPVNVSSKIILIDSNDTGSGKELFVITSSIPENSDKDNIAVNELSPLIGIAYFRSEGKYWKLILNKFIRQMGNWEEAPELSVWKIGKNKKGYAFHTGVTLQGVISESILLYAIHNNTFVEVLSIAPSYETNQGACDQSSNNCYEFDTEVKFDSSSTKEFYNVAVTTIGTTLNKENKVEEVNKVKNYTFTNKGKYESYTTFKIEGKKW